MMNPIPPKRIILSCLVLLVVACLVLALWAAAALGFFRNPGQPDNSFDGTAWQAAPVAEELAGIDPYDFHISLE
jgi:hypothetical protein